MMPRLEVDLKYAVILFCWSLTVLGGVMGSGCDRIVTNRPTEGDNFESPLEGMSPSLNAVFIQGDENFERTFTVEEGLGPIFNNVGCESCHPADGRGTPELGFTRFGLGGDPAAELGGPQHQDKAIPGVPLEEMPSGMERTFRMPPPVFGVGMIEAIPAWVILSRADPNDLDGDGISGRPNMVHAAEFVSGSHVGGGPGLQLGRFSRKAQVSSLLQQVAEAYHQDIGITSDFIPVETPHPQAGGIAIGDRVADPEIPAATVLETVTYVRQLRPPERGEITPEVERGDQLFNEIGCAACHVPTMRTGASSIPELSHIDVHLFSDLLLHDMGPDLADFRPDGDASGTEWRTAPLWGLRLVEEFLNGEAFYLHDGRTSDLGEAILFHGGEASAARNRFAGLSDEDREALLAFLRSL
ncbi:MAG: c-type cytochrome [Gemmatimonadetes bacterium]|nr:c-type cytochrome [Gemmatimonadota bacterium]MYB60618.1 c-type cytochrome [Gemmatimonadota bacterium]